MRQVPCSAPFTLDPEETLVGEAPQLPDGSVAAEPEHVAIVSVLELGLALASADDLLGLPDDLVADSVPKAVHLDHDGFRCIGHVERENLDAIDPDPPGMAPDRRSRRPGTARESSTASSG